MTFVSTNFGSTVTLAWIFWSCVAFDNIAAATVTLLASLTSTSAAEPRIADISWLVVALNVMLNRTITLVFADELTTSVLVSETLKAVALRFITAEPMTVVSLLM